jgi:alpha/beta superfamily hydrolase
VAPVSSPTRFIPSGSEQVCVVWHPAAAARARDTAVIICPPFGWDEICSYRSRRDWAQQLATAGYSTLRIAFPGTGDSSGGPLQAGRLQAWTDAVGASRDWLRNAGHATRIALVGLGLGGLVGYHAAAAGCEIDDLVLWATPARGRELVRQLRAFSRLESSELGGAPATAAPETEVPESGLEVGGFRLSDETLQDLSALDLTAEPGPLTSRRVLLLERDGLPVDRRLLEHLESLDVDVTVAPGEGYAAMIAPPQVAVTPVAVISAVIAWLDVASAPSPVPASAPAVPATSPFVANPEPALTDATTTIAVCADAWVTETPITIAQPFGNVVGILTEPTGERVPEFCVVLLNAGAIRRIGPNRMWVEAARRWAQRGVPTVRFDVQALGDTDGEADYRDDKALYVPRLVVQVLAVVDELQRAGVADRFVLGGLCSGAYWAFHAAVQDERVAAAWMINPRALIWDPGPSPERDLRNVTSQPLSLARLRKAFGPRGLSLARFMFTTMFRRLMRRGAAPPLVARRDDELRETLKELREAGKHAVMVFAQDEPLYDAFAEAGLLGELEQAPEFTIERVAVSDHTIRPGWAQRAVHEALDRALDEELKRAPTILAP